jgi:hypothetical protein
VSCVGPGPAPVWSPPWRTRGACTTPTHVPGARRPWQRAAFLLLSCPTSSPTTTWYVADGRCSGALSCLICLQCALSRRRNAIVFLCATQALLRNIRYTQPKNGILCVPFGCVAPVLDAPCGDLPRWVPLRPLTACPCPVASLCLRHTATTHAPCCRPCSERLL